MSQISMATQEDMTLMIPTRFALGFMKSVDNLHLPSGYMESLIMGERAFGYGGGQALVDAAYRSVGYTSRKGGVWIR